MDSEFINAIVCEYARGYVCLFLERFRSELDRSSYGLVSLLERWLGSNTTFNAAWDPSLGKIRKAVLSEGIDPIAAAIVLALHLCSNGTYGTWGATLQRPLRIRWAGLLFPHTTEVNVSGREDDFVVNLRGPSGLQSDVTMHRSNGAWQATTTCEELPHCRLDKHELLVGVDSLESWGTGDNNLIYRSSQQILIICCQAISLLRRHAPPYLQWVDKVVRQVIPLNGAEGILRSSSNTDWPGAIGVSFPSKPIMVAEMLVHEASHQYFHIATRFRPVHDRSDRRLYHSPVKGESRPIDAILLAFHAFANVLLFYRSCIESGVEDQGYCERSATRHRSELEPMLDYLRLPNSLTETGRLLWEPLASRLFIAEQLRR